MPDDVTTLRKTLKIISVGTPKPIGKATLYPFRAVIVGKDEEKDYETWSKTLADEIQKDAEVDAEIEYSQKGEYKHRKVVQIYKNGEPVLKAGGRKTFRGQRDEDRTDIRTAMMCITELRKEGKIEENDPLMLMFRTWCYAVGGATVTTRKKES